jgi:hypothetical protein
MITGKAGANLWDVRVDVPFEYTEATGHVRQSQRHITAKVFAMCAKDATELTMQAYPGATVYGVHVVEGSLDNRVLIDDEKAVTMAGTTAISVSKDASVWEARYTVDVQSSSGGCYKSVRSAKVIANTAGDAISLVEQRDGTASVTNLSHRGGSRVLIHDEVLA